MMHLKEDFECAKIDKITKKWTKKMQKNFNYAVEKRLSVGRNETK